MHQLILLVPAYLLGGQAFAEKAGQRATPIRVMAGDPPGGFPHLRIGRRQFRRHRLGLELAAIHLVEGNQRRSTSRRLDHEQAGHEQAGSGGVVVGDFDQRKNQGVFQSAILLPAGPVKQVRHRAFVADPPERFGRGPPVLHGAAR